MKRLLTILLVLLMLSFFGCASKTGETASSTASDSESRVSAAPSVRPTEQSATAEEDIESVGEGDSDDEDWDDPEGDYGDDWDDEDWDDELDYPVPDVLRRYPIYEALYEFTAGRSWASYFDGKDRYYGLIDTNGIVAFSMKDDRFGQKGFDVALYEDGVYVLYGYNDAPGFIAVDGYGKVIFDGTGTEEDAYYFAGYGAGRILAVEHIADFSENTYWFLEIDMDGEIAYRSELSITEYNFMELEYIGNDIVFGKYNGANLFTDQYNNYAFSILYDLQSHQFMYPPDIICPFYEDLAVVRTGINRYGYVSINEIRQAEKNGETNFYCKNELNVSYPYGVGNGRYIDECGIHNYKGELLATFPDNWTVTGANVFSGGYAGVSLQGADGNQYVTVINEKGEPQYKPMKVDSWSSTAIVHFNHVIDSSWHGFLLVVKDGQERIYNPQGKWSYFDEIEEQSLDYSLNDAIYRAGMRLDYDKRLKRCTRFVNNYDESLSEVYIVNNLDEVFGEDVFFPDPELAEKDYIHPKNFSIIGKWKNTGTYSFARLKQNATIEFKRRSQYSTGYYCSLINKNDFCDFYEDGDDYIMIIGDDFSFNIRLTVKIIDNNHIDLYYGDDCLELTRVSN